MQDLPDQIRLTYDQNDMDLDAMAKIIHGTYWGKSFSAKQITRSFTFSFCAGLIQDGRQVAFARAISDRVTSAYVKDFIVLAGFRRKGLGRRMMEGLLAHPDLGDEPSWYLGTKDAQPFYQSLGFKPPPDGIYMYRHLSAPA